MDKYCVDQEVGNELDKKGFPQNTFFNWYFNDSWFCTYADIDDPFESEMRRFSAPNSDELLKELPSVIIKGNFKYYLDIDFYLNGKMEIDYKSTDESYLLMTSRIFDKLSNALAHIWLTLKEEGYLDEK
jgi:hypothetical protein